MKIITTFSFVILSFESLGFITVGTDVDCDFTPAQLQPAIDSHTDIRITNQTTYGTVEIIDRSVNIQGGYDNCTDARNDQVGGTLTELSGQNATTVMHIATTANTGHALQNVAINNLKLTKGQTSTGNLAGGLDINGHLNITINRVDFNDNTATTHGGGMYVSGHEGTHVIMNDVSFRFNEANVGGAMVISSGAKVSITDGFINNNNATANSGGILLTSNSSLSFYDSVISSNRSPKGGGIYCSSSRLFMDKDSRLSHNQADRGGGLFADSDCVGLIESGHANEPDTLEGINSNLADYQGAGIYAFNATLTLKGSNNHHINMHGNITTSSSQQNMGAAIYAYGNNSNITLINARLTNNRAQRGAAIAAINGARVTVKRSTGDCFADDQCSLIDGNTASRGAFYISDCALLQVYQTTIRHNISDDTAVAWLSGNQQDNCPQVMEGNVIYGNQNAFSETAALIHLDNKVNLEFAFNTVTDNLTDIVFRLGQSTNSQQTLDLNNSIIWNAPAASINDTENHQFNGNCLLVHDADNLPAVFGDLVINLNPEFENPQDNDYQLSIISPPIDYCDTSLYQPQHHDILSVPRGYEMTSPVSGYFDMGAYEFDNGNHFNDVIFYDRFQ